MKNELGNNSSDRSVHSGENIDRRDAHSDVRLSRRDFIPIAVNGCGDGGNAYAHSMAWFRDSLYVGMTRHGLNGARPYDRGKEMLIWPVSVPEVHWDLDWRGQIWRYQPSSGRVENTHLSPMIKGNRGFNIPRQWGYRDMRVFQGKSDPEPVLYATSWGSHMGPGPYIMRCDDGIHFEETRNAGPDIFGGQTLRSLVQLRDKLFTIPTGRCGGTDVVHAGIVLLESDDPRYGNWKQISVPCNNKKNVTVFEIEVFNDNLYAGTMNPYEGLELWRTDARGEPPYKWTKVLSGGAGRGPLNEIVCSLCVFQGALYVASSIYNIGYDRIYNVGPGWPELMRVHPDDSWELIVGEPRKTSEGFKVPLSGFLPGFNSIFNGYFWRMCVYGGRLYVGTAAWTPWLPFARRHKWSDAAKRALPEDRIPDFVEKYSGFELWCTANGNTWEPAVEHGFGNPFNCGARTMVASPYGLFVGTINQFGPEVAVARTAGWRYEPNPRGGAEIWLGTKQALPADVELIPLQREIMPVKQTSVELAPPKESQEMSYLDEFFGNSGWRRIGFWGPGIQSPQAACKNLLAELLAYTKPDPEPRLPTYPDAETFKRWPGRKLERPWEHAFAIKYELSRDCILDLGCGLGKSTEFLLDHYESRCIFAATTNSTETSHVRRRIPGIVVKQSKLPSIGFDSASFDTVICAEGAVRVESKNALFREIHRVLRPGGQFVGSDLSYADCRDGFIGRSAYMRNLESLGFERIRVEDVSGKTLRPLREQLKAFLTERLLTNELDVNESKQITELLAIRDDGAPRYFMISAYKCASEVV